MHELPLLAALRSRGAEVIPLVWDRDPVPAPGRGDLVVVRTPWDYLAKYPLFLEWLDRMPKTRMHNSAAVLRWNSEKSYLRELDLAGVRVVPTRWMKAGTEAEVVATVRKAYPGLRKIVKPSRSAGSLDTYLLGSDETPPAGKFVDRPAMIQPYFAEIETDGERSLIYFSGKFSHAVRKLPRAGEFRVQESFGGLFSSFEPSVSELEFGETALVAIRFRFPNEPSPLYARIDYILTKDGPALMEAELLEPDLFFHHAPGAAERFAAAIEALED